MINEYIRKILTSKVYDVAIETPIDRMTFLSKRFSNNIFIKREDLQPVFSFKLRGAYNRIASLTENEKARGIIAASAGNHAQGVALAAKKLKIKAHIVMPTTTPEIKVNSVKARQAEVILHGDSFDQAYTHAIKLMKQHNYTFIHPYDDPDVIAGQGTIGMEILRQFTAPLKAVFVPVGGGGLIAGIAIYLKYLAPSIKVIGVESEDSASMKAALEKRKRVTLDEVGIFADGVAVAQAGKEPFKIVSQFVDEVITVNTDEICAAIKDLFDDTRSIAEPAGALALGGLKKYIQTHNLKNHNLLAIESGANVNFDRLRHISERTELGEKREIILAVTIPEKPGSFKEFCSALEDHNITEFNYRYGHTQKARVFVGVQTRRRGESGDTLVDRLNKKGYTALDMTNNELAKLHIRHMVGGHAPGITDERLFRFEFPERPQALSTFLNKMEKQWNISMFHYRNHGAAFGRVFLGLQVPDEQEEQLKKFLINLNYHYKEETDNPAYELFLK